MLVFSKAKLVFLSVPKTGTTAYHAALSPLASMAVSDPPVLKHAPIFRYNRFFRPMLEKFIGDDLEIVAVMREPVSWLGSWHRYRQRPSMKGHPNSTHDINFDEFVQAYMQAQQPSFANVGFQSKFLEPSGNGTAVTHLFRYEDQTGLITFLEARLGVRIETEMLNISPGKSPTLSNDIKTRLRHRCSMEFELWEGIKAGGTYTQIPS